LRVGESEPSSNRGDELKFEFIERVNPSSNSDSAPLVREAAGLAAPLPGRTSRPMGEFLHWPKPLKTPRE
jgi:hypothetical protein